MADTSDKTVVLPTWASLLLLVGLIGGALALALALDARPSPVPTGVDRSAAATIYEDLLTGRRLDEKGVPLPPETGWGSRAKPIRIRFVPSSDSAQAAPTVERLLDFLEKRTGYYVEGATLRSYGMVVEEIVSGQCEIAFLTATSYQRAFFATANNGNPDDDIEAFLQVVRRGSPDFPGSDLSYRAALIVRTDSPLQAIADITDDTVVAMGPRTSGAGSILPTALFMRLGVQPRILRLEGSYPLIVPAVLQGSAEVGCVWWSPPNEELPHNDARMTVTQAHPEVFDATRIIGFTAWMPNEPVVARKALPIEIRHTFARALILYTSLLTLTEEGRRELTAVGSPVGFIPATNEDFLPLKKLIEQAFANDPEGWSDFQAGRR